MSAENFTYHQRDMPSLKVVATGQVEVGGDVRLGRTAAERGGTGVNWGSVLAASLLLSALCNEKEYREISMCHKPHWIAA